MRIGPWTADERVLVVAEVGNNHEGSLQLAEQLVGLAADAGAGAVKFQTFHSPEYAGASDPARIERLWRFRLEPEDFQRLADLARNAGLLFLSTPLDIPSCRMLAPMVDAMKIASGDISFVPLLDAAAASGKPVVLSTGAADLAQVHSSSARIQGGSPLASTDALAVLHCVSSYPTPAAEANLGAISTLREALRCTVGYSDHTIGNDAAVLAVGLGARIIEKHFTVDHEYSDFRDHQLSAEPSQLRELVQRVGDAEVLLGDGIKRIMACEDETATAIRRSIVAARDLPAGEILGSDDLTWARPGDGLAPGAEGQLLGRRLARSVSAGEKITPDLLASR